MKKEARVNLAFSDFSNYIVEKENNQANKLVQLVNSAKPKKLDKNNLSVIEEDDLESKRSNLGFEHGNQTSSVNLITA